MPRRTAPLQVNKFSKGLVTEANPLEMPPDISIDELNMEIDSDGSRFKRLGFQQETDQVDVPTSVPFVVEDNLATSQFRWENAGGVADKALMIVQVGPYIGIHDLDDETSVSNGLIYSENYDASSYETLFSYAVVDGLLVVVNGLKDVIIYEYDPDLNTVSKTTDNLLIRDLIGVEAGDLTTQDNLQERPASLTDEHIYNLRNQTFYSPRYANDVETEVDPIDAFYTSSGSTVYPSNADDLNYYLYADPNDAGNRLVERFFSDNMVLSSPSVGESSKGHFIIDALERGASRVDKESELRTRYPLLTQSVSTLPEDKTPGGATTVEEFAGRIWYGGFSGTLIGGDSKSPRMSSYLLFSRLVKDKTDISQCYQRADPTSNEDSALVDTDGGFIRIEGAYGLLKLVNLEGNLFAFCRNGVWRISGGDGSNFAATNYSSDKLSEEGCISGGSVVTVGSQIFYWGDRGIFNISRNEFGIWVVRDFSTGVIESFYGDIEEDLKRSCVGLFDSYDQKIRWVYSSPSSSATSSKELVFDTRFKAMLPMETPVDTGGLPIVVGAGEGQPYNLTSFQADVTVNGEVVTVNGEPVTVEVAKRSTGFKQSMYLVLTQYSPTLKYTFGRYDSTSYYDWVDIDYSAYLVSGGLTGGEARYKKQTPYLNTFFKKTEVGFESDLTPIGASSCLLSSQWNWTSGSQSGKWSTPRQAYRIGRLYFPEDSSDTYDSGDTVISTRNKIRGTGHAVSFRFESEGGKDMYIHGWSFDLMAATKE